MTTVQPKDIRLQKSSSQGKGQKKERDHHSVLDNGELERIGNIIKKKIMKKKRKLEVLRTLKYCISKDINQRRLPGLQPVIN